MCGGTRLRVESFHQPHSRHLHSREIANGIVGWQKARFAVKSAVIFGYHGVNDQCGDFRPIGLYPMLDIIDESPADFLSKSDPNAIQ